MGENLKAAWANFKFRGFAPVAQCCNFPLIILWSGVRIPHDYGGEAMAKNVLKVGCNGYQGCHAYGHV